MDSLLIIYSPAGGSNLFKSYINVLDNFYTLNSQFKNNANMLITKKKCYLIDYLTLRISQKA